MKLTLFVYLAVIDAYVTVVQTPSEAKTKTIASFAGKKSTHLLRHLMLER